MKEPPNLRRALVPVAVVGVAAIAPRPSRNTAFVVTRTILQRRGRQLHLWSRLAGSVPVKGERNQPSSCFLGWHMTDVGPVNELYNGFKARTLNSCSGLGAACR